MNGDADDQRDKVYRIKIPGMSGFVSWPAEKKLSPEVKDIIIKRYMAKYSPVPQKIQWIPGIINQIDDAQDILTVALTLAKPLLRRLPGRFIPYLGWILLVNDLLNLSTAVLSIALNGRPGKNIGRNVLRYLGGNRMQKLGIVSAWLKTTNWLGFALQAGQVSSTLTGYGLKLGPVMGMITDFTWGSVRKLQGKQVRIVGPPPDDFIFKAGRFLAQNSLEMQAGDILSEEHHSLLIAANNIATNALRDAPHSSILEERAPLLKTTEVAVYEPYDEDTRYVLKANGIPWDGPLRPCTTLKTNTPTYYDYIRNGAAQTENYERYRRYYGGTTEQTGVTQLLYREAGSNVFDKMAETEDNVIDEWSGENNTVQACIEFGVYPPKTASYQDVNDWLSGMPYFLSDAGLTFPTTEMLKTTLLESFGAYDSEAPLGGYEK